MKNKKIIKQHNDYEDSLFEALKNPIEAIAYLNAALQDPDQRVFLLALKDVLTAQSVDISALAEESQITRQNVYRMLSKAGNPRWNNLSSLIDTMGLQIKLESKNK